MKDWCEERMVKSMFGIGPEKREIERVEPRWVAWVSERG